MSTLTLDSVTSYAGDDSTPSHTAFRYDLSYSDQPFTSNYVDPYTLVQQNAAGSHQLISITPTVYQSGTAHQRKGVQLGYTGTLEDYYRDPNNKTLDNSQEFGGQSFWTYLNSYEDLDTGVGQ